MSTLQGAAPHGRPTQSWVNNNFLGFFNFTGVTDAVSLQATGTGNNWNKSAAVASVSAPKATSHDVMGSKLPSGKILVLTSSNFSIRIKKKVC